ncbi:uncharacterized protein LOC130556742 isoform X2 [Triplophysa rosa]|uniref:uncharacterized protein LOC130556742 isoform X2 n=1 Tax=Triplophysa rosa TaxID=992332 RepID=UPI0025462821|nr:uncharacterized protein LOC130556742 isoform X2 [Triplophysa rosa]
MNSQVIFKSAEAVDAFHWYQPITSWADFVEEAEALAPIQRLDVPSWAFVDLTVRSRDPEPSPLVPATGEEKRVAQMQKKRSALKIDTSIKELNRLLDGLHLSTEMPATSTPAGPPQRNPYSRVFRKEEPPFRAAGPSRRNPYSRVFRKEEPPFRAAGPSQRNPYSWVFRKEDPSFKAAGPSQRNYPYSRVYRKEEPRFKAAGPPQRNPYSMVFRKEEPPFRAAGPSRRNPYSRVFRKEEPPFRAAGPSRRNPYSRVFRKEEPPFRAAGPSQRNPYSWVFRKEDPSFKAAGPSQRNPYSRVFRKEEPPFRAAGPSQRNPYSWVFRKEDPSFKAAGPSQRNYPYSRVYRKEEPRFKAAGPPHRYYPYSWDFRKQEPPFKADGPPHFRRNPHASRQWKTEYIRQIDRPKPPSDVSRFKLRPATFGFVQTQKKRSTRKTDTCIEELNRLLDGLHLTNATPARFTPTPLPQRNPPASSQWKTEYLSPLDRPKCKYIRPPSFDFAQMQKKRSTLKIDTSIKELNRLLDGLHLSTEISATPTPARLPQ